MSKVGLSFMAFFIMEFRPLKRSIISYLSMKDFMMSEIVSVVVYNILNSSFSTKLSIAFFTFSKDCFVAYFSAAYFSYFSRSKYVGQLVIYSSKLIIYYS